ncbi:methyltransferase domain-containing protein [Candidatus Sumerlaeota bacterium]|nr:methyltransferase domain-containing protein [Candidatus Sumerlaeota bacterium]
MTDTTRNLNLWSRANVAEEYEQEHQGIVGRYIYESETQMILEAVRRRVPARLLDAGCGTGRHLIHLENCGELYGIDYSEKMLEAARQKVKNCRFTCGSIHQTPYDAEFFDMIICVRVLQHVGDAEAVLREFYRILNKGGEAHVLVYNAWHLHHLGDKIRHSALAGRISERAREGGYWKRLYRDYYNRFYSPPELIRAARAAGFGETRIRGATLGMGWCLHSAGLDRIAFRPIRALLSAIVAFSRLRRDAFRDVFPFNHLFDSFVLIARKTPNRGPVNRGQSPNFLFAL